MTYTVIVGVSLQTPAAHSGLVTRPAAHLVKCPPSDCLRAGTKGCETNCDGLDPVRWVKRFD